MPIIVEKCKFHTKKTDFVGFIIELGQISMDLKKIQAIVNWQDLETVIGLRLFLGFCNYYSRKMTLLELNYNIYNKELLAAVAALKEWRAFLQGTIELFIVKMDYKNLIGFLIIKELN